MQPPVLTNYPRAGTFTDNKYLLKRHLMKLVGGRYSILTSTGQLAVLAEKKGFKLKAQIHCFADEQMTQPLFDIMARQIVDFSAAYDVIDAATQTRIGALKRKGWKSIMRDEWIVMDANDVEIGKVVEDSLALGLIRRFLTNLVPQNYDCIVHGETVTDLRQSFNPFAYNLNIDFMVPPERFDRRMGFAAAILLAAIEGRQRG